ncbi:hypothetical protein PM082_008458 [Marasmius tenuissimus]|nr:hypothetical protein PM082_008458 [Marasmius tenuissimus]
MIHPSRPEQDRISSNVKIPKLATADHLRAAQVVATERMVSAWATAAGKRQYPVLSVPPQAGEVVYSIPGIEAVSPFESFNMLWYIRGRSLYFCQYRPWKGLAQI